MRTAVVTMTFGDAYEQIAKLTHPTLQAYADKIGAQFVVISKQSFEPGSVPIGYEKLQLRDYLHLYDRIVYLDTDLIVRPDTPNLFDFVEPGMFCAFNEGAWISSRLEALKDATKQFGLSAPNFKDRYYNTGVMVFDKEHAGVFADPPKFIDHFYEQTYLNIMLARTKADLRELPHSFNRMSHLDENKQTNDHRLESYIVHYAGALNNIGLDNLLTAIGDDLREWKRLEKQDYHVPKIIKVSVGGGLGDQIEAEPTVREIRRLYPKDRVIVASHWPELFEDLPYQVESVDIRNHSISEPIYAVFHTYASPDGEAWKYMTHVFAHSADFSSQLAIRRVLPPEKKSIQIGYTAQDFVNTYAKLGVLPGYLDDAVCIHPGRSWRTKTMSSEFWQDIIQRCVDLGYKTVVFGKDGKDAQGLVALKELPKEVLDAREKLSIKESLVLLDHSKILVSNDSAPIHMAGATDIWILGIFTAKHPSFVIPFRKGRQDYKTLQTNGTPACWPCNVDAKTTSLDEVRADFCSNVATPYCCFPTTDRVMTAITAVVNDAI